MARRLVGPPPHAYPTVRGPEAPLRARWATLCPARPARSRAPAPRSAAPRHPRRRRGAALVRAPGSRFPAPLGEDGGEVSVPSWENGVKNKTFLPGKSLQKDRREKMPLCCQVSAGADGYPPRQPGGPRSGKRRASAPRPAPGSRGPQPLPSPGALATHVAVNAPAKESRLS